MLIDKVIQQGFSGMSEFMLVLEYDLPAIYFFVTKEEAREPPAGELISDDVIYVYMCSVVGVTAFLHLVVARLKSISILRPKLCRQISKLLNHLL